VIGRRTCHQNWGRARPHVVPVRATSAITHYEETLTRTLARLQPFACGFIEDLQT
jgi:hypothetical protein